ncbi:MULTISPECIES: diaminobutyrate--2-oxoglutarate transaminase [Oceanobacillus]|uniref:Diaminobutyrate--2-oxoglutarate transaminase n=1 Tax=Oceanobacillus profundus TaxID=372463 RepID=A0A417YME8_9BACI|nr:diaminobutyrate--2-oxoglutarate transaminase [Oceanobacillus profundus]MBR3120477.1 diaminobutyrate--2-oxoglutarate transaminase [Oceanobacillus sp.]MCM3399165.1 diaminobutyrate--2-oxoglutarate transaminase [Oceanobacillus profundus]PAE29660.1 diaminobutyrate--2-oxoglutarate transaminase [Paenibacillus sp. 7884-2]RHW34640.1 diaminobutyrate--2-oxoglutarate transaminase [Oceanobacillus profundus]
MKTFEELESAVRSYSRGWPTVFNKAKGYKLWDTDGKEYIDFFAGAGTMNYGHNDDTMQQKVIEYIQNDGIIHSLDMGTTPRKEFLENFKEIILTPRKLDYKIMFPGPTGTNTVESALKIARKVTGRETVISFTNAFHGMTIGSLSVTGNSFKRHGAGVPLHHSVSMPFDNYVENHDSIAYLERFLEDSGSGVALPAAIILETVQGEGGINAARIEWLQKIEELCKRWDILLIVDDVQAGNGRTGTFFSFEPAGIEPDVVCLSKSIGGFGLPMAITLIKPEHDKWGPGEHNGTFRGNNLAFIAATEALSYWKNNDFEKEVQEKAEILKTAVSTIIEKYPELNGEARGRGLMQGIAVEEEGLATEICAEAFQRGLIVETSGPKDEVVKFLPPLIIDKVGLEKGFQLLDDSINYVLNK